MWDVFGWCLVATWRLPPPVPPPTAYLKTGSISPFGGLAELKFCAHRSQKQCCGEFHSRATLSSSRLQGRTPPNAVPRTPCPKAKARAGRSSRHGPPPHSTVFAVFEKRAAFCPFGHPKKGNKESHTHRAVHPRCRQPSRTEQRCFPQPRG